MQADAALPLPSLCGLTANPTRVPFPADVLSPSTLRPDKQIVDVPRDGSCLYHCLYGMYQVSKEWAPLPWGLQQPASANDLKESIAFFFLENFETLFKDQWGGFLRQAFPTASANGASEGELASRYINERMLRPGEWGGELELDVASHFFNVIIHLFEKNTANHPSSTGRLSLSFYPNEEMSDRNRTLTKWVVVLDNIHYQYVVPVRPSALGPPATRPAPPPMNDAEAMRRLRERRRPAEERRPRVDLKQLRDERERRERGERGERPRNDGRDDDDDRCLAALHQLTLNEQEQLDREMAMRVQREEEARLRQLQEDADMARRLAMQ